MKIVNNIRSFLLEDDFEIRIYKNRINIVNYDSIGHFDPNKINIYYSNGLITIKGDNLVVSKLLKDEVLITGIIKNIEMQIVPTATLMVKYFEEYCKKNSNPFFVAEVKNAVEVFNDAFNEINTCIEELKGKNTEDTALNILKTIYDTVFEIRETILIVLNKEKTRIINQKEKVKEEVQDNKDLTKSVLSTLFVLDNINKKDAKLINKSVYSEKEMDYYGLDEFEKNLVRQGKYAPWQFEHENTEEGDYYHYE